MNAEPDDDESLCALCGQVESQHGSWIHSHRFTPAEPRSDGDE